MPQFSEHSTLRISEERHAIFERVTAAPGSSAALLFTGLPTKCHAREYLDAYWYWSANTAHAATALRFARRKPRTTELYPKQIE
jgi:hypothetical protein